jgi:lytic murein transglycosylase
MFDHLKRSSRSILTGMCGSAAVILVAFVSPAMAASCGNNGAGFSGWLDQFAKEAAAQGVSAKALAALNGLTYDPQVIRLDRGQHSFKLSFEAFYARRVNDALIRRGQRLIAAHRATFDRIEKRYGVPPSIIASIWGLETNYGAIGGKMSIIRSIATLAYDCRRTAFFQNELMSALKIVQRGDMSPSQLRGGWAGEIGQTQFLPSAYYKYAVDFDGDGRRDLIHSVPDMLASTANYLRAYGWQAGQSWSAGSANYNVIQQWNKAQVYVKTIAVMASKMENSSRRAASN